MVDDITPDDTPGNTTPGAAAQPTDPEPPANAQALRLTPSSSHESEGRLVAVPSADWTVGSNGSSSAGRLRQLSASAASLLSSLGASLGRRSRSLSAGPPSPHPCTGGAGWAAVCLPDAEHSTAVSTVVSDQLEEAPTIDLVLAAPPTINLSHPPKKTPIRTPSTNSLAVGGASGPNARAAREGAVECTDTRDSYDTRYLARTFAAHAVCLALTLAFEALFLFLCARITPTGPIVFLDQAARVLDARRRELTLIAAQPSNILGLTGALRSLYAAALDFNAAAARAKELGRQVWVVEMVAFALGLALLLGVGAVSYAKRHHTAVKSRGREFLMLAFVSSTLTLILSQCMAATYYLRFSNFPDATDFRNTAAIESELNKLTNLLYVFIAAITCANCTFLSALVMRQRVIHLIFTREIPTRGSAHGYMWPYPFTLVVVAVGLVSYTVWRFGTNYDTSQTWWGVTGIIAMAVIYTAALAFYYVRTRQAHLQFSDFYSNVRLLVCMDGSVVVLLAHIMTHPTSIVAHCAGWSSFLRFLILIQALDQLCTQAILSHTQAPPLRFHLPSLSLRNLKPVPPRSRT